MSQKRTYLIKERERLEKEIKKIYEIGEVARYGVNVVNYYVKGYEYYKLVAPSPIFDGKNGKKTKTKHLGKNWNGPSCQEAVMSVLRRRAITEMEKQIGLIEELIDVDLPTAAELKVKRQ
jgi:hypothetical protein